MGEALPSSRGDELTIQGFEEHTIRGVRNSSGPEGCVNGFSRSL